MRVICSVVWWCNGVADGPLCLAAGHRADEGKSNVRVIWGRLARPHGNTGTFRAKFSVHIPPNAFGASCRVVRRRVFFFFLLSSFLCC